MCDEDKEALDSAIRIFKVGLLFDQSSSTLANDLGIAQRRRYKKYKKPAVADVNAAIRSFGEAARLNPVQNVYYVNLGDAYRDKHKITGSKLDTREAIRNYMKAIELAPGDPYAQWSTGIAVDDAAETVADLRDAQDRYRTALSLLPDKPGLDDADKAGLYDRLADIEACFGLAAEGKQRKAHLEEAVRLYKEQSAFEKDATIKGQLSDFSKTLVGAEHKSDRDKEILKPLRDDTGCPTG